MADKAELSSEDLAFTIAPRINAAGRLGQAPLGIELMTTSQPERAQALAEYLQEPDVDVRLTGERREVTVLAVRIQNYTALTERLAPEQLVQTLNRYYAILTAIITERGVARAPYSESLKRMAAALAYE